MKELTDEQKKQLLDHEIDTSDIPEAPEESWANAKRGLFFKKERKND